MCVLAPVCFPCYNEPTWLIGRCDRARSSKYADTTLCNDIRVGPDIYPPRERGCGIEGCRRKKCQEWLNGEETKPGNRKQQHRYDNEQWKSYEFTNEFLRAYRGSEAQVAATERERRIVAARQAAPRCGLKESHIQSKYPPEDLSAYFYTHGGKHYYFDGFYGANQTRQRTGQGNGYRDMGLVRTAPAATMGNYYLNTNQYERRGVPVVANGVAVLPAPFGVTGQAATYVSGPAPPVEGYEETWSYEGATILGPNGYITWSGT